MIKIEKSLIKVPTRSCHASNIALLGDELHAVWFGGTAEGASDVCIYHSLRKAGMWSEPVLIAGETDLPHWNPVLFSEGGSLHLYYKVGKTIPRWHTRYMRSDDGGRTWSKTRELVPGDIGGRGPVRNKPLRLSCGRLLAPASIETESAWNAFADISDDDGSSFRRSAYVPLERDRFSGKGAIQPALWETENGKVHMLLRSTEGCILRSDSEDAGETWCTAYDTGIPNNNSGIDLCRIDDGRLLLACNPVRGNWASRSPLTLFVSRDDGDTFERTADIETGDGEFSYPSLTYGGGKAYLSYTWKRQAIAAAEIVMD